MGKFFNFLYIQIKIKIPNFQHYPLKVKKFASGRVKKYPGQTWVGLLFTAGQKYARVKSGPISRQDEKLLVKRAKKIYKHQADFSFYGPCGKYLFFVSHILSKKQQ